MGYFTIKSAILVYLSDLHRCLPVDDPDKDREIAHPLSDRSQNGSKEVFLSLQITLIFRK